MAWRGGRSASWCGRGVSVWVGAGEDLNLGGVVGVTSVNEINREFVIQWE